MHLRNSTYPLHEAPDLRCNFTYKEIYPGVGKNSCNEHYNTGIDFYKQKAEVKIALNSSDTKRIGDNKTVRVEERAISPYS